MNIESPSPWILSKSTQIESGPDSAEFVGSVGWYRSWWAWASLGFRGTHEHLEQQPLLILLWHVGCLGCWLKVGWGCNENRNVIYLLLEIVQRSVTSRVTGARPWPCCTTCFPLWSFLRWSRQSDVYACLRMSTLWIWSNIGSKRLWQIDEIDEIDEMDSWIHGFMRLTIWQCNAHLKRFQVVGHLKTLYPALWDAASFGGILFVLGMSQCSIAQREAWTLGRCSGIGGRGHWIH